jgi:hypothetical protein
MVYLFSKLISLNRCLGLALGSGLAKFLPQGPDFPFQCRDVRLFGLNDIGELLGKYSKYESPSILLLDY